MVHVTYCRSETLHRFIEFIHICRAKIGARCYSAMFSAKLASLRVPSGGVAREAADARGSGRTRSLIGTAVIAALGGVLQPGGHFYIAAFFGGGWSDACGRPRLLTFRSPDSTIPVLRNALGRLHGACNGPHMPRHVGRLADSSRYIRDQLRGASTVPTNPSTCIVVAVTAAVSPSAATIIGLNVAARPRLELRKRGAHCTCHCRHCGGSRARHCGNHCDVSSRSEARPQGWRCRRRRRISRQIQ